MLLYSYDVGIRSREVQPGLGRLAVGFLLVAAAVFAVPACAGRAAPAKPASGVEVPRQFVRGPLRSLDVDGSGGCAVDAKGSVFCWTMPYYDQPARQRVVPFLPHVAEARVGAGIACARSSDGRVWCFPPTVDHYLIELTGKREPLQIPRAKKLLMRREEVCVQLVAGGFACWNAPSPEETFRTYPRAVAVALEGVSRFWFRGRLVAYPNQVKWEFSNGKGLYFPVAKLAQLNQGYARLADGSLHRVGTKGLEPLGMSAIDFDAEDDHLCRITPSHQLECWGTNRQGQIRPDSSTLGYGKLQLLRRDARGMRIELHPGLTCLIDREGNRSCRGNCALLPDALGIPCKARSVPVREPGAPNGGLPCRLGPFDETQPCLPGDHEDSVGARCDVWGRWQVPRGVPTIGNPPRTDQMYVRGESIPVQSLDMSYVARRLAYQSGRVIVLALRYKDEPNELDCLRAQNVRRDLVAAGLCAEKLRIVRTPPTDPLPRPYRVGVQFVTEELAIVNGFREVGYDVDDPEPCAFSSSASGVGAVVPVE